MVVAARAPVVTLVGCGAIGSRHLQGLLARSAPSIIQVVEPASAAVARGKARADEVATVHRHAVRWFDALANSEPPDLAIVATNAPERPAVLRRLLASGCRRFVIEKMVCQSDATYSALVAEFKDVSARGWVHCPRRYYPCYRALSTLTRDMAAVRLRVRTGNMGLGSVAIHFVDLLSYLAGQPLSTLDGTRLDPGVLSNKRGEDLLEFSGTLTGQCGVKQQLEMSFCRQHEHNLVIEVETDAFTCTIDETKEEIEWSGSVSDGRVGDFRHCLARDLIPQVADEIFAGGDCELPTLEDSQPIHRELFRVFNDHIFAATGSRPADCPIT